MTRIPNKERTARKTCPGHGSDYVKGKCPDCVIERDGWARKSNPLENENDVKK